MRKGFTLMELIIVVIIVGILAAIAVPQFFRVAERGRAAEAVNALGGWRASQIRFASENGRTTNVRGNLDYESTALRFFGAPTLVNAINPRPVAAANTIIASMTRNLTNNAYAAYTLRIEVNGDITCTGNADGCDAAGY